MLFVTTDTNIYVSGLNFTGNPRTFLNLAEAGGVRLFVSDAILDELERVLRGKKFQWPEERIQSARRQLLRFTNHVTPLETLNVVKDDPSDNRILECAVASKSDYLVTGDRHLLDLQHHGEIRIVTVAEFLALLPALGAQH